METEYTNPAGGHVPAIALSQHLTAIALLQPIHQGPFVCDSEDNRGTGWDYQCFVDFVPKTGKGARGQACSGADFGDPRWKTLLT